MESWQSRAFRQCVGLYLDLLCDDHLHYADRSSGHGCERELPL